MEEKCNGEYYGPWRRLIQAFKFLCLVCASLASVQHIKLYVLIIVALFSFFSIWCPLLQMIIEAAFIDRLLVQQW